MTQLQALLQEDCEKQQQQRACRRRDFVGRRQSSRLPTAAESSQQQQTMVFSAVELADASALCASNEKRRRSLGRLQLLEEQQCCRPSIRAARRVLVAILACAASASRNALPLPKPWLGRTCQQDESAARRRPAACCRQTLILPLPLSMLLLLLLLQSRGSEPSDAPHSSAVAAAYVGLSSTTSHRTMPLGRSLPSARRRMSVAAAAAAGEPSGPNPTRPARGTRRGVERGSLVGVAGGQRDDGVPLLSAAAAGRAGPGRARRSSAHAHSVARLPARPRARRRRHDRSCVLFYFVRCLRFVGNSSGGSADMSDIVARRASHTHTFGRRSLARSVGRRPASAALAAASSEKLE